ncbi:MAG: hypothetical protein K5773_06385 [Pseudobutyrivibrio sp.]|nr:hypothetical protein [Pseudobutyrivibrio sp.]
MLDIFENVKYIIGAHKAAAIATASVVGLSAVGAGGAAVYNHLNQPEEVKAEEEQPQYNNADVYIPTFKKVLITSESVEKDITIYINGSDDQPVTGTNFQVKLISPEDAKQLESYTSAISDVDEQIKEYTQNYEESLKDSPDKDKEAHEVEESANEDDAALPVDGQGIDFSKNKDKKSDEKSEDENSEEEPSLNIEDDPDPSDVLSARNPEVTVTDEEGEVVETLTSSIEEDPLYQLYLDKETAIQAYSIALNDIEGTVYTDDDADGVISETEIEPGDYVACLMDSEDSDINFDQVEGASPVNVKDKVEYKVVKEIKKQIKKDDAAEDGQPKEAAPIEETLKDTVEFVESKKVENGSKAQATTDVVAPKTTAKNSKATAEKGGITSVKHTLKAEEKTYKITITYEYTYIDKDGKNTVKTEDKSETVKAGAKPTAAPQTIDFGGNKYTLISDPGFVAADKDASYTVKYKYEEPKQEEKPAEDPEEKPEEGGVDQGSGTGEQGENTEGNEGGDSQEEGDQATEENENAGDNGGDGTGDGAYIPRHTFFAAKGMAAHRFLLAAANTGAKEETATLDMTYKEGVFTIKASDNVGSIKVNDTEVKNGGTYTATKDGNYTLTGVATFSDKATDNTLKITYVVSGFGTATTDRLKDKAGNELFLDEALTKPATAADYKQGQTYYYKAATYTYYGWQSIKGITYYYDKNGNVVTGTQVIQGVQYNFGSDGALLVNGTGIDVSKYQGNIDWSQAAGSVSFAIIRCGYRGMYDGQLHEDPYFYQNMKNAKANGVKTGIYIYSTALNEAEAVQEASMAVAMAKSAGGCAYPIYIDMEDSTRGVRSLSNAQRNAIINAFCSTVQSAGYKGGVYANKTWLTNYIDAGSLSGSISVWVAQYNTSCTYNGKYTMWQYSSKGSVPGIKGNVDMNKSFF